MNSRSQRVPSPIHARKGGRFLAIFLTAMLWSLSLMATGAFADTPVLSISFDHTTLYPGDTANATVVLQDPAPSPDGATVNISTDNNTIWMPGSVVVPAGSTTTTFACWAGDMTEPISDTVTASYNGGTASTVLSGIPVAPMTLTLNPASVAGGQTSTGTITLNAPAMLYGSGVQVTITTDQNAYIYGGSVTSPGQTAIVTIGPGLSSGTFSLGTNPVTVENDMTVTATIGNYSQAAVLTILPTVPQTLTLSANTVPSSQFVTGTVTLTSPSPTFGSGTVVAISSDNPSFVFLSNNTITIPAGQSSGGFVIYAGEVPTETTVNLFATVEGASASNALTILPEYASGLTVVPSTLYPGQSALGTVTLSYATSPWSSGDIVGLSFYDPSGQNAIWAPSTVLIPAGQTSAGFGVYANPISQPTDATVSATYAGVTQTAPVHVEPILVQSVSLSPANLFAGQTSVGTVTLTKPVPIYGSPVSVQVTMFDPSGQYPVWFPQPVTVAPGQSAGYFPIYTWNVPQQANVTISASIAGVSQSAVLTVNPVVPASITISPSTIYPNQVATGSVTLNAPAPIGQDIPVTLSWVDPTGQNAVYIWPTQVTVPGGQSTANFTVTGNEVSSPALTTISASANVRISTAQGQASPANQSWGSSTPTSRHTGTPAAVAQIERRVGDINAAPRYFR